MTTKRSIKWGLVAAAAAFAAVAAMPGCELLVDFDRSKILDGGDFDGTTPETDGGFPESSIPEDGGSGEGASDAPADAPSEGAVEAGSEAAAPDTGPDAPLETGAGDGATDSGDDGG